MTRRRKRYRLRRIVPWPARRETGLLGRKQRVLGVVRQGRAMQMLRPPGSIPQSRRARPWRRRALTSMTLPRALWPTGAPARRKASPRRSTPPCALQTPSTTCPLATRLCSKEPPRGKPWRQRERPRKRLRPPLGSEPGLWPAAALPSDPHRSPRFPRCRRSRRFVSSLRRAPKPVVPVLHLR